MRQIHNNDNVNGDVFFWHNRKLCRKNTSLLANSKGITLIDVSVAIIVAMIFISINLSIYTNVYLNLMNIKRETNIMSYVIQELENIQKADYNDVVNKEEEIFSGVTSKTVVKKYNELPGKQGKEDCIKIVEITVYYDVGDRTEKFSIKTLKTM